MKQGIPENMQQEEPQAAPTPSAPSAPSAPAGEDAPAAEQSGDEPVNLFEAAAQAGGGGQGGNQAAGRGGGGGEGLPNLEFLRNNPHFQHIRQMIQQNPNMLEPILQQIAAGNPQIAQLIGQNGDQFMNLLGEDEENPLPQGVQQISVTEEERDAIERVSDFAWEENLTLTYASFATSGSSAISSFRCTLRSTRTKS